MATLPKNAHVSTHPCLKAKLSLLRSAGTSSRDVQTLVHEIALMVGYEALASGLKTQDGDVVCLHLQRPSTRLHVHVSALAAEQAPRTCHATRYTPLSYDAQHRYNSCYVHLIDKLTRRYRTSPHSATTTPPAPPPRPPPPSPSSPSSAQASPWSRR
jgi:hypothetical protein